MIRGELFLFSGLYNGKNMLENDLLVASVNTLPFWVESLFENLQCSSQHAVAILDSST